MTSVKLGLGVLDLVGEALLELGKSARRGACLTLQGKF